MKDQIGKTRIRYTLVVIALPNNWHLRNIAMSLEVQSYPTLSNRLFLSYARSDDEPFVRRLYNDLRKHNFKPWYDREKMTIDGSPFTQAISDAIRASERLIVVVGPRSVASPYCQAEWELALKLCIPVVPLLRLGDYDIIPSTIGRNHAIDCRVERPYEQALQEIIRILNDPIHSLSSLGVTPPLPPSYIERLDYLTPLKEAVRSGDPLLTITSHQENAGLLGIAGIGKTVLACALCNDCEVRRTFDNIFWIDVGPQRHRSDVPDLMRATVGGKPEDYDSEITARANFARILAERKTLIVLDDVWDSNILQAFQFSGEDCRLLVTTRLKNLIDNRNLEFILVDKLNTDQAFSLLCGRAGREILLNEASAIIVHLDGHTLAITLAGIWLRINPTKSPLDLLMRLEKRADFRDLALDAMDKNLNLEHALRLSYDDLNPTAQTHFRALGILAQAQVTLEILAKLWNIEDQVDAEDALNVLINAGLLSANNNIYNIHSLIRVYARALLDAKGEIELQFGRYADYVIEQVMEFETLPLNQWKNVDFLLPHVQQVGSELIRRWNNTESSTNEVLLRRSGDFAQNVTNLVGYRPQIVETPEGIRLRGMEWLEMGLAVSRHQSNYGRQALFANNIGYAWWQLNEKIKALSFYEQALQAIRLEGDHQGEAITISNIGMAWADLGEKRKALDFYEQALPILRSLGDRRSEAVLLNNMGATWADLGEKRKALDLHEQALPILRSLGDHRNEAFTLNNIGLCWKDLGETGKAINFYEQALPLFRLDGDRNGEAIALTNIGAVWRDLGEGHKAIQFYEQALPLFQAVGHRSGEATILNNIGNVWSDLGNKREALAVHEQALSLVHQIDDKSLEGVILHNIGAEWRDLGEGDRAMEAYRKALLLRHNIGDRSGEVMTLSGIAMVYQNLGDVENAIAYIERAIETTYSEDPNKKIYQEKLDQFKQERTKGTP